MESEIVNLDMPLHLLNVHTHTHLEQTHHTNTAEVLEKNDAATGQLTLKYEQEHVAQGRDHRLELCSQRTALFSSVREGELETFV